MEKLEFEAHFANNGKPGLDNSPAARKLVLKVSVRWRGFNDFNKKECKRTSDPAIMRITHPSLDCCRRGNGGMRKG